MPVEVIHGLNVVRPPAWTTEEDRAGAEEGLDIAVDRAESRPDLRRDAKFPAEVREGSAQVVSVQGSSAIVTETSELRTRAPSSPNAEVEPEDAATRPTMRPFRCWVV